MPKTSKEDGNKVLPKDLPMPKYEYQKPGYQTFTSSFVEEGTQQRNGVTEKDEFCLQNFKLTL